MASFKSKQQAAQLRMQLAMLTRRLRQETQESPVPFSHLAVMGAIDRLGDKASPTAIAQGERLYSSNLAAALRELEGSGYIARSKDAFDRRRTRIALTAQGRQTLYESRAQREQWLASAMKSCLSAEERNYLVKAGVLLERLARFESSPVQTPVTLRNKHL